MASEPEHAESTAEANESERPAKSERPRRKKAKRPKLPIPQTEEEINSPDKQTLGMLAVLGILTLIMWSFARGACNFHPPKESRRPRTVTTAELARDPKDAAVELQQRWATKNYAGALELSTEALSAEIKSEQAACDANAGACKKERAELAKKVQTVAALLERDMTTAAVRVTTLGLPGGPKTHLMRVERADSIWKVTARVPDSGQTAPAPKGP
jgi:hypothetical protein